MQASASRNAREESYKVTVTVGSLMAVSTWPVAFNRQLTGTA